MLWSVFAALTACFEACKDVASKQALRQLDEYAVTGGMMACSVVVLLPVVLLQGVPPLTSTFWVALGTGGLLNIWAFSLYVRAIKVADLSLTVPLVTLTPLFMLVTSPLIVGEYPTLADGLGVVLLIAGAYLLNLRERRYGYLEPLKTLWRNPGSRMMLGVAVLWSVTSNIDKVGVLNSSPLCWTLALFGVVGVGMVPMLLWRVYRGAYDSVFQSSQSSQGAYGRRLALPNSEGLLGVEARGARTGVNRWRLRLSAPVFCQLLSKLSFRLGLILALAGIFNALGVGFQMVAVEHIPVTQVIAIKRMSALLSVLMGHFIFKEKGLQERLLGAVIMVSGVVIINLA